MAKGRQRATRLKNSLVDLLARDDPGTQRDFLIFWFRHVFPDSLNNCAKTQLASGLDETGAILGRLTYTGGYVLPGTAPGAEQKVLPADVEDAAIEQVRFGFGTGTSLA
jgi:hypothetical protein